MYMLSAVLLPHPAIAQSPAWPAKPVKVIVAYPAGGGTPEEFGRFIASEITKWRQLAATAGIKAEWTP